jgi:mono/diheme cytochrome c family protein
MAQQKSLFQIVKWKVVGAAVVGGVLWTVSGLLDFPRVFQWMFVFYAFLGFVVFVMLDLPPMKEITGGKAIAAIVVFYIGCSAVYVAASNFLPQYDPEWEKGKIAKILEKKKKLAETVSTRELYAKTQELMEKADAVMAKLEGLEGGTADVGKATKPITEKPKRTPGIPLSPEELVAAGKEAYDLYECYNCHKIGGKGSTKKRGPKLDNIGNLLKAEDLKRKILDPKYILAEGFEKEHKKGLMPDNYKEIMDEEELDALVAYLATLKDTSVDTPKPIFHPDGQH